VKNDDGARAGPVSNDDDRGQAFTDVSSENAGSLVSTSDGPPSPSLARGSAETAVRAVNKACRSSAGIFSSLAFHRWVFRGWAGVWRGAVTVFCCAPGPRPLKKEVGGARSGSGGLSKGKRYQAAGRAGAVGGELVAVGWDYGEIRDTGESGEQLARKKLRRRGRPPTE